MAINEYILEVEREVEDRVVDAGGVGCAEVACNYDNQ